MAVYGRRYRVSALLLGLPFVTLVSSLSWRSTRTVAGLAHCDLKKCPHVSEPCDLNHWGISCLNYSLGELDTPDNAVRYNVERSPVSFQVEDRAIDAGSEPYRSRRAQTFRNKVRRPAVKRLDRVGEGEAVAATAARGEKKTAET